MCQEKRKKKKKKSLYMDQNVLYTANFESMIGRLLRGLCVLGEIKSLHMVCVLTSWDLWEKHWSH